MNRIIKTFIGNYSWVFKGSFARVSWGMIASNMAVWLSEFTVIWWAVNEMNSSLHAGFIVASGGIITVLLSPWTGWIADRFHRGKIVACCDFCLLVPFLLLVGLVHFDMLAIWHMYMIHPLISLIKSPIRPSSQSLIPEVVKKEHLEKAVAFQNTAAEASLVLGPALAGVIIGFGSFEMAWVTCVLLVGLSSLFELRIQDPRGSQIDVKWNKKQVSTGFIQLFKRPALRLFAISTAVSQMIFTGFPLYLVVWAANVLHVNSEIAGTFQSFFSLGVVAISFVLVFGAKQRHVKIVAPMTDILTGIFILSLVFIVKIPVAYAVLLMIGLMAGASNVYYSGFLQRITEGPERGRLLAAFFAINAGLTPLGNAFAGALSGYLEPLWLFVIVAIPMPLIAFFNWKAIRIAESVKTDSQELTSSG
ncbi:MFS transporter [Virgibacillus sp. FSP13]